MAPDVATYVKVRRGMAAKNGHPRRCHQKAVSEGIQCCAWLVTSPGPKDVVESYIGGQDFWANKIRVKYTRGRS